MTLAATTTLEQAASRTWDTVVVGAGPAGSFTARELARRGASVLLVDKARFPRWKVCGCCLNGAALDALKAVGLPELAGRLGSVRLHGLRLAAGGYHALVPLPTGSSVSREAFDCALIEAGIASGVCFLPATRAILEKADDGVAFLRLEQETQIVPIRARITVAAGGLAGRLRAGDEEFETPVESGSRLGAGTPVAEAPAFYEPGTIYMACAREGYLGLVRLEDGRLDAAAALDKGFVRESDGLGGAALQILKQSNWPTIPDFAALPWRGTPALTRYSKRLGGQRYFVVGDAAGYVEPFTGEGIAWALHSAIALAPIARQAIQRWQPSLVKSWTATHSRLLGRRQSICRLVAHGLRSPALTGLAVAMLAGMPILARPLVQHLNRRPIPSWGFFA